MCTQCYGVQVANSMDGVVLELVYFLSSDKSDISLQRFLFPCQHLATTIVFVLKISSLLFLSAIHLLLSPQLS